MRVPEVPRVKRRGVEVEKKEERRGEERRRGGEERRRGVEKMGRGVEEVKRRRARRRG